MAIYNEIGVRRTTPFTLCNLGRVAFEKGDIQQAQAYFEESSHISRSLENRGEMASALRHLGHIHCEAQNNERSEAAGYYKPNPENSSRYECTATGSGHLCEVFPPAGANG